MSSVLDSLTRQMTGGTMQQIGQQLGVDEARASTAVAAALPLLMSALSRNASQPSGAESLFNALSRDHDGGVLDDLAGYLPNANAGPGASILGHVLGDKRGAVTANLGRTTGLDGAKAAMLLATLAPLVLGALGRARKQGGLDAGSLTSMLAGETSAFQQRSGAGASLVNSMLDSDGDGSITDDIAEQGLGMLGQLFGGKR